MIKLRVFHPSAGFFARVAGAIILGGLTLALAAAEPSRKMFNLPAGDAAATLKDFTRQSGEQVIYPLEQVRGLKTNEVKGEFAAREALDRMVAGTGLTVVEDAQTGALAIKRDALPNGPGAASMESGARPEKIAKTDEAGPAGAIKGRLVSMARGHSVAGVHVTIEETGASAEADGNGRFEFQAVRPSRYTLLATGDGFARLRIARVMVRPGEATTLALEEMRVAGAGEDATGAEVSVSGKKDVLALQPFEVVDRAPGAFSDANVDIPRTLNDPQAYVIFNQRTIEQSGATNVEGFLRERLTMSSTFASDSQLATPTSPFSQKTNSSFSMRGLGSGTTGGTQQVVILVNGRRLANLAQQGLDYQTDLNGIPLGAIDRIEVLPSSASGIYGGGAVSGVINVVLKRHYAGTDIRATYSSPFDVSAPTRTIDLTSGLTLEGGKTNVLFTAAYSDGDLLRLQDRQGPFRASLARVLANSPLAFAATPGVFVGTTPNIVSTTTITAIGSNITYIPPGYRGFAQDGLAPLLANAGKLNYEPAPTANYFTGLRQSMGAAPEVKSLHATVRREMTPWLEAFVEGSYRSNIGTGYNGNLATQGITVPATAPTNPFHQQVSVAVPSLEEWLQQSKSISRAMDAGLTVKLPQGWQAQGDFSWNEFRSAGISFSRDATAVNAAIAAGTLDPFRDTLKYGFDLSPYAANTYFNGRSSVNESTLRAAGLLWFVPWIQPHLVFSVNYRKEGRDDQTSATIYPSHTSVDRLLVYPGQSQSTDGFYAESVFPLVTPQRKIPGIHLLELQVAGREDRIEVRTTRPVGPALATGSYDASTRPTLMSGTTHYSSTNPTLAGRWQPVADIMLRGSFANGYAAPTFSQLTPGNPSTVTTTILDPLRGNSSVAIIPNPTGGNPNLTPEKSRDWNAGIVLTPRFVRGLRLAVDYVYIVKDNSIATLTPQQIVTNEAVFPGRVTRGPVPAGDRFAVGPITGVDATALNLNKQIVEAYDFSANYRRETQSHGVFDLTAMASYQPHFKQRAAPGAPMLEYSNTPANGGVLKWRGNAQLTWDYKYWTLGWASQFYNRYRQNGPPLLASTSLIVQQGSDTIPAQVYHDAFVRYQFSSASREAHWWVRTFGDLQVQFGVKNVFDHVPPFDANQKSTFYFSPYGDFRLRSYYVSVRRMF